MQLQTKITSLTDIEERISVFTEAIPQLKHSKKMFGRQDSQWTSQLMSLTMLGDGPFHFMKQCMAQIDKKKQALQSNYFSLKKDFIKLKRFEEKNDELSQIRADELRLAIVESQDLIDHAIREIKMYQKAYDEICESYGIDDSWDEVDFLKLEEENHIRMAFRLTVRRLNEGNSVDRGTAEYLEANGIHPMAAERYSRQYIDSVNKLLDEGLAPPIKHFYDFLDKMVEIFKGSYKDTTERIGIKNIIKEEATMLSHDHPEHGLYLDQHGFKNAETKMLEKAQELKKLEH